ncbi:MAG: polyprenyl synthetase family protein [Polyangiaceae bacterium]
MNVARALSQATGDFSLEVERALGRALAKEALRCDPDRTVLVDAAKHITFGDGAKRARPQLCERFGLIVGAKPESVRNVAIAAEWIHTASLLHDDVVDDGKVRRGRPTVNVRWKNSTAVLSGDLLLSLAMQAVEKEPRIITQKATEVVAEMARASILEVRERGRVDVAVATYDLIAEGKTGALFGFCGFGIGALAGDLKTAARFEKAARALGLAFQIADDVRDLLATSDDKDRLADLREKMPSFPTVLAASSSPQIRAQLQRAWATKKVSRETALSLRTAIFGTSALPIAQQSIRDAVDRTKKLLAPWRAHPAAVDVIGWGEAMFAAISREIAEAPVDLKSPKKTSRS